MHAMSSVAFHNSLRHHVLGYGLDFITTLKHTWTHVYIFTPHHDVWTPRLCESGTELGQGQLPQGTIVCLE